MKARALALFPAAKGFVSAKLAIVLAILAAGACLLVYEWHEAHGPAKQHHVSVSAPKHHHKKGGGKEGKKSASKAADTGSATK